LEEKDRIIRNLEAEIVTFRKYLQQKNIKNSSKVLDNIINSWNPYHDKSRIGYNNIERGSSSKTIGQETYPRSYANTVKGDKKFYKEDHSHNPPPRQFRF
jgi:hypothetical protein